MNTLDAIAQDLQLALVDSSCAGRREHDLIVHALKRAQAAQHDILRFAVGELQIAGRMEAAQKVREAIS